MRSLTLFNIIIAASLLLHHDYSKSEDYGESDFVYVNCADQSFSPPLVNCQRLWIDRYLRHALIHDVMENQEKSKDDSNRFLVTNIPGIPIAIPKNQYYESKKWRYENNLYLKIRTNFKSFLTKQEVDVIAVIGNADKIANVTTINDLNNIDALNNLSLIFWYSKGTGVEAIGFPTKYSSGDVYYCVSKSCLFGQ